MPRDRARRRVGALTALVWLLWFDSLLAAKLQPQTLQAWDRYVPWAEQLFARETQGGRGFLIEDYLAASDAAEVRSEMRAGAAVVRKRTGVVPPGVTFSIPDGTIHHWWGGVLVRGATLDQVIRFMQDYDHHAGRFAEVERSRLISRNANTFRFYLRLRRTKPPITVYYNTENESRYWTPAQGRALIHNDVTKIAELENPGTPRERELTNQEDWGFLWAAVQWWRLAQTSDGVIVECETASLARDVPRWLRLIPGLMRYIDSVPRESIANTLLAIHPDHY